MTRRTLSDFIDAIATGRRPAPFRASPEDAEVVRAAVELRAVRPTDATPTTAFREDLFQRLAEQAQRQQQPTRIRTVTRARTVVLAAAAAVVLVSGTAAATGALISPSSSPGAVAVPQGSTLRTGTFLNVDGRALGQIVAYRGHPSWVFMNVVVPDYDGSIRCTLQVEDGSTVAFGTFTVTDGTGQFAKSIGSVDVAHLRGAKLVTSTGSTVAHATFAG